MEPVKMLPSPNNGYYFYLFIDPYIHSEYWIDLAHGRDMWWAVVNAVMNLRVV
jgi:hypothetical protein